MFDFRNKSSEELDVEESQIAANYAAITAYNGPLRWGSASNQCSTGWLIIISFRKFSAEIPETITEDEWNYYLVACLGIILFMPFNSIFSDIFYNKDKAL